MSHAEVVLVSMLLALTTSMALAGDPPFRSGQEVMHRPGARAMPPAHDPLQWVPGPNVLRGDRPGDLELVLDVPPGFVVYRDQLHVEVVDGADLHVGHPDIPPGMIRLVPGRDDVPREQYDTDIVVRIPAHAADLEPGMRTVQVRVRHQGCFGGHCFRPQELIVPVHVPVRPEDADEPTPPKVDAEGNPLEAPPAATEPATAPPVETGGTWQRTHPAPSVVVFVDTP